MRALVVLLAAGTTPFCGSYNPSTDAPGAVDDAIKDGFGRSGIAGIRVANTRWKHLRRPATSQRFIAEIETLAKSADLSIPRSQRKIAGRTSRGDRRGHPQACLR